MKNVISETIRPSGAKITLSSWEENGTVTYIVKSSHNTHDKRFYGIFRLAVNRYNELVEEENTRGKNEVDKDIDSEFGKDYTNKFMGGK